MSRTIVLLVASLALPACHAPLAGSGAASPTRDGTHEPIIDVHLHAYPPTTPFPDGIPNPVTGAPNQLKDGEAHLQAVLAEMKRFNIVTGVVSGGTGDRIAAAIHWHEVAPERFLAGAGIRGSADTPLPDFTVVRQAFQDGRLRVIGEVTAEYAGLTLNDAVYEPYLALAEQLDLPVSLHTGTAPPGTSFDPCCHNFRVALGNPLLIEEALNRHPKLRVNLMHAGWPYLEETIALLNLYPQVYVDLGALGWGLPRAELYAYLQGLVRAGYGKRIMFGSDEMYWPELIARSVEAIDAAPFLSAAERHDIFYGNAARFLKLDAAKAR